jgi:hypothetical protein
MGFSNPRFKALPCSFTPDFSHKGPQGSSSACLLDGKTSLKGWAEQNFMCCCQTKIGQKSKLIHYRIKRLSAI